MDIGFPGRPRPSGKGVVGVSEWNFIKEEREIRKIPLGLRGIGQRRPGKVPDLSPSVPRQNVEDYDH